MARRRTTTRRQPPQSQHPTRRPERGQRARGVGRWKAVFDHKTCAACRALSGAIVSDTKATRPPLHAACRCTLEPVVGVPRGRVRAEARRNDARVRELRRSPLNSPAGSARRTARSERPRGP